MTRVIETRYPCCEHRWCVTHAYSSGAPCQTLPTNWHSFRCARTDCYGASPIELVIA